MTQAEYILMRYHTLLMKKHGILGAERLMTPLSWYINTGRASVDYIRRLEKADENRVVAILEQDGSVEAVLNNLVAFLYNEGRPRCTR